MTHRETAPRSDERSREAYERTVAAIDAWTVDSFGHGPLTEQARAALDRALNADADSPWNRDIVERGYATGDVDLVVNGNIGVVLVRQFTQGEATNVGRDLLSHANVYDYLVVYLHGIPRRHADRWRLLENRQTATGHALDGVAFVHAPRPDSMGSVEGVLPRLVAPLFVVSVVAGLSAGIVASRDPFVVVGSLVTAFVVLVTATWWYA
jgi:hypothetical protein